MLTKVGPTVLIILVSLLAVVAPLQVFAASDGYFRNIYLDDNGQIQSADPNHRILFRRTENILELREYGDIFLSSGSTNGSSTGKLVVKSNGRVGIGANSGTTNNYAGVLEVRDNPGQIAEGSSDLVRIRAYYYSPNGNGNLLNVGTTGATGWEIFQVKADRRVIVNGTLSAKEIKVQSNPWADFVFEDGYKLLTLEEVENYIHENGRLPGIESADEIEENGLSVGEMQAKQMQKIEELTLYAIEQEKRIDSVEKEMKELREMLQKFI